MKLRALCKLIDRRNWLWGKLGLALVISTPLIPFSSDGWGYVLSLSGLRPNCGRGNGKLLRKDLGLGLLYSVPLTPLQSLLTHASAGDSQTLTGKSLVESLLLSRGSWCASGFVCALQESCFPCPVEVL